MKLTSSNAQWRSNLWVLEEFLDLTIDKEPADAAIKYLKSIARGDDGATRPSEGGKTMQGQAVAATQAVLETQAVDEEPWDEEPWDEEEDWKMEEEAWDEEPWDEEEEWKEG